MSPVDTQPFATVRPRFADGDAGRIAYRDDGAGPAVVFIHGVNMASAVWDRVADLLPGRRRIAFDLRGHGDSDTRGPFGIDDYVADLWAVIAAAQAGQVQLVGVSLGGMIACLAAQGRPEAVTSVVAFGSALRGSHPDLEGGMRRLRRVGVAEYFGASLQRNSLPAGVSPAVQEAAVALAVRSGRDVSVVEAVTRTGFTTDLTGRAGPSGRPTLIVSGSLDTTCAPEAGRRLAEAVGGRAVVIPNRGHLLPLEAPQTCAPLIAKAGSQADLR